MSGYWQDQEGEWRFALIFLGLCAAIGGFSWLAVAVFT